MFFDPNFQKAISLGSGSAIIKVDRNEINSEQLSLFKIYGIHFSKNEGLQPTYQTVSDLLILAANELYFPHAPSPAMPNIISKRGRVTIEYKTREKNKTINLYKDNCLNKSHRYLFNELWLSFTIMHLPQIAYNSEINNPSLSVKINSSASFT